MNLILYVLLMVTLACPVLAQTPPPGEGKEGEVGSKFAGYDREAGIVCGEFLPNQIQGVTEMMALCGGRLGFRLGPKTVMEPQFVGGAGKGQRYLLGSLNFRGDVQIDDVIGSMYIGPDIHYATSPIYDTTPTGEATNMYFGGHVGGAIWWELADSLYFRTDLQFNFNPGTSLYVGFSFTLRYGSGGSEGGNQAGAGAK